MSLQDVNALCYEPLILEGYCIGSIGFHAKQVTNYDNKKKRLILRLLAKRAAWALQDYRMARVIRDRAEADALIQILGVVLHNIKTPLASVQIAFDRLVSDYATMHAQTPRMEGFISTINGELSRISRLQQAVLRLRRPWESRVETTSLHQLIRKVVTEQVGSNEIETQFLLTPSLRNVAIDSAAVEVCLEILVDNAVDALQGSSTKRLLIGLRETATTGVVGDGSSKELVIDVVDSGPGVPPEMIERLFTAMQSAKTSGAGIGLVSCRAIARLARGDVIFDSQRSPGAKFTLVLPYRKEGA